MFKMKNFVRMLGTDIEYVTAHLKSRHFSVVEDTPGLHPTAPPLDLDYIHTKWNSLLDTDNSVMSGPIVRKLTNGQKNFLFKLSYRVLVAETSLRSKNWIDHGLFGFTRLVDQTNYAVITLYPAIRPFFRAVTVKGSSIPNQIAVEASSHNDKTVCALLAITSYLIRNALRFSDGVINNHHVDKALQRWNRTYSINKLSELWRS